MIKFSLTGNRRRLPAKYAAIAALVAAVAAAGMELAGTALTRSYSGLGGKLAPASGGAAEIAPASAPASAPAARPALR